jgi:septum formation protein
MKIVLASASPRRADILRDAGIPFEVVVAEVDESPRRGEHPADLVRRLAEAKAREVAGFAAAPAIVVGADTMVVLNDAILGKPGSDAEARAMLERLSGKTHEVMTGLAVIRLPDGKTRVELEATRVTVAPLSAREIRDYIASGEPMDKAGAYAIQGIAGRFVTRVEGCYFNVIGLPLARLYRILRELGWSETDSAKTRTV